MSLLSSNTQRQGVLMAPDGPCVSPPTAPSRTTECFLAIVTPGCNHVNMTRAWRWRGVGWMRLVWVLWKDVWNRSMGIKGLGSVGGLLCWRLSPLLASMISSIDTEALLRSLCVFCQLLSHYSISLSPSLSLFFPPHSPRARCLLTSLLRLPLALSQSQRIWKVLRSPALLFQLTGFRPLRLMAVSGDDERSLMQCFPRLLLYGCRLEALWDRAAKSMRTTSSVVFRVFFWETRETTQFFNEHKLSHFRFHVTVQSSLRHPTS